LKVWHDGRLVDGPLALDANDRGLLLGDGAFETIAVHAGRAIWRDDHLARLMRTAEFLGIPIARDAIEAGIDAVLKQPDGILRITVTRGPVARGLGTDGDKPSILITLSPWIDGLEFVPAKLITAMTRRNELSPSSRHKTLSYMDNILAAREAAAAGADDALMLNAQGRIACSTIANVFLLHKDRMVTPPESEGALPGIARQRLIAAAHDLGLRCDIRPIEPKELRGDTALFLTNSLRLIRPVTELDGKSCASLGLLLGRMAEALQMPTTADRVRRKWRPPE
jgi:branched-chain amino acid aminotransferase